MASELTDLPLPDSPTSATVVLRGTSNDTVSTAGAPCASAALWPLPALKLMVRLRTWSSASMGGLI